MEVRVRSDEETKGKVLGDIPVTDAACEEVIALLKRWGLETDQTWNASDLSGTFVLNDTGIYFEVTVCEQ